MRVDILTIFPEMLSGPLGTSIIKKARESGLLDVRVHNIRDWAHDKHRVTDDYPFGGGAGMVMKPEPLFEAVEAIKSTAVGSAADGCPAGAGHVDEPPWVILTSPQGRLFTQDVARELAARSWLVIVCGHYEGVDERVRVALVDDEVSIGDYVLTGGELPAMVVVDAVARMIPGVLSPGSVEEDSFYSGLLDYPHYTRPQVYRGMAVPEVLVSGDHARIRLWRRKESLRRTLQRRPDLLEKARLSDEDKVLLREIREELCDLNTRLPGGGPRGPGSRSGA